MVQETAVIKKPPGEIVGDSHSKLRLYEVIVKFHKDGREMIETFLLANMMSVTISATGNDEVLLAYCHFSGDIKTLDSKLAALRQSAMIVLGHEEEKFLDFFVALKQLSQPLPRLLSNGKGIGTISTCLRPEWIKGFLLAFGLLFVWWGISFVSGSVSRALNPPPPPIPSNSADPTQIVSQWAPYVLSEHHRLWTDVKKKHGLSDETMMNLFRLIKVIDKYGPGQQLRDLTIYPRVIDRALGLIILRDIGNTEALQALRKTLEGYSAYWQPLPDRNRELGLFDKQIRAFDDQVVLIFYEQLLKEPHREFTERLIQQLRRAHFSS